ncbi:MAG: hypothetical protein AAB688_00580 [Patescibacteria group bacterium]
MNKINFANIILISAVVFLFVGTSQVYAVPAAPNKTNITAEILSVQQIDSSSNLASNFVKILEIKVIKYESVEGTFSAPDELKVYVHKWTNDLAIVDKLEKGQTITATISYSGDERGGMRDIREIKIIKSPINILYKTYQTPILIGGGILIILLIWLISKRRAKIS